MPTPHRNALGLAGTPTWDLLVVRPKCNSISRLCCPDEIGRGAWLYPAGSNPSLSFDLGSTPGHTNGHSVWLVQCPPFGTRVSSHSLKTWRLRSFEDYKLPLGVRVRVNGVCV